MRILLFALIIAIPFTVSAQQLIVKTNGTTKNVPLSVNGVAVASVDDRPLLSESPDDDLRVIVELKAPSRIEQRLSGRSFSKTISDRARRSVRTVLPDARIHQEFETVISALCMTVKRSEVNDIASLQDVKAVYADAAVNASPFASPASAAAAAPQSSTAVATGKGVRIGIIDTGIDYRHEAFGGTFGAGHVIAGGYDLVNNDDDPMDDNGHGTHVAGIICGKSSSLTGAASDATVYIYKALDQNGSGSASSVIAAIERAIADSIHVLNLSLGTPSGSADDPLASAVNRAVQSGMVVVVAAGNTSDYSSINSPGIAAEALTVGAADGSAIASFSSKGPEIQSYGIKPDVVAPGVSILSAKMGGGYIPMSGTSMAAPFVTALAAALKELHPDWTGRNIRDAVISNTRDLGKPLFSQGHGMADSRVLTSTAFSAPAQLSFGFDPPGVTSWTQQRTITLYNTGASQRIYTMSSAVSNPAITLTFTPKQITVAPNSTASVTVELSANNLFLANNNSFESGYTGNIVATGTDTVSIPFAFIKAPVLQLSFNEVPWMVLIHNRSNYTRTISPKTNSLSLIIKDGSYDVVASFYGSRYVVKENIAVNGKASLDMASTQAVFPVSFQPVNEKGEALSLGTIKGTQSYLEAFVHQPTGFALVGMGGGKTTSYSNRPKYFSAVSSNYAYGYSMTLQPTNGNSYTYDIVIDSGISAARPVTFTAQDMKRVDVKYNLASGVQRAFPITWTTFVGKYSTLSVTFYDGNSEPLRFPFAQSAFYTQRPTTFPIFHQREAYSY
jgi:hypothetical protein